MPRDSLVVRWFVHARRFLAAKHSRLGKLAVLGTPGAAKCVRFRKLAVRNAKGGKEAALYSKGVPGRESLVKGSPLAPRESRKPRAWTPLTRCGRISTSAPMPTN